MRKRRKLCIRCQQVFVPYPDEPEVCSKCDKPQVLPEWNSDDEDDDASS